MAQSASAHCVSPQKAPTTDAHAQPTEVVYITSSVYKGGGPQPRVLKRRDKTYMLPKSPESPTKREKQRPGSRSTLTPGSVHRRTKDRFISVDGESQLIQNMTPVFKDTNGSCFLLACLVSELLVDSIKLVTAGVAFKSSNSCWSPSECVFF